VDDVDAALPALAHVHFKDVRRTADGWAYVPAGDGEVELKKLAVKFTGSSAVLGLELPLRLTRRSGSDPERRRSPLDLMAIRAAVRLSVHRVAQWLGSPPTNAIGTST
jgi:sugar phosphate isomerase/epimerase